MAQKQKSAPPKPGGGASVTPPTASSKRRSGSGAMRATITIFALFCILGAVPTALGGEAFGVWRLPSSGVSIDSLPWTMSYDAPLAKTTPMVANTTLHVATTPGGATNEATLEPGFAVKVSRYATVAGVRWSQITWGGPTRASGGTGWTLAAGLIAISGATQARDIGDLGALSPSFGQATSAFAPGFTSALYFPSTGASYHTSDIEQEQPLGSQAIPLVLAALYAKGIVASQPNAASGPPPIAHDLVNGNPQALTFDYALVGNASGMTGFLSGHHIQGFQWVADKPLESQGSVRSLSLFYAALLDGSLVNAHDQAEMLSLLAGANSSETVAPQSIVGTGVLVVTSDTSAGSVMMTVAGVLSPANGAQAVVVASFHGATAAAAQQEAQTYFSKLIPIVHG
ncbi:MAG TPA: hypothetical protein VF792_04585 [Ktedonobacterales bacterium]